MRKGKDFEEGLQITHSVLVDDVDDDNESAILLAVVDKSNPSDLDVPLERLNKQQAILIYFNLIKTNVKIEWRLLLLLLESTEEEKSPFSAKERAHREEKVGTEDTRETLLGFCKSYKLYWSGLGFLMGSNLINSLLS